MAYTTTKIGPDFYDSIFIHPSIFHPWKIKKNKVLLFKINFRWKTRLLTRSASSDTTSSSLTIRFEKTDLFFIFGKSLPFHRWCKFAVVPIYKINTSNIGCNFLNRDINSESYSKLDHCKHLLNSPLPLKGHKRELFDDPEDDQGSF